MLLGVMYRKFNVCRQISGEALVDSLVILQPADIAGDLSNHYEPSQCNWRPPIFKNRPEMTIVLKFDSDVDKIPNRFWIEGTDQGAPVEIVPTFSPAAVVSETHYETIHVQRM